MKSKLNPHDSRSKTVPSEKKHEPHATQSDGNQYSLSLQGLVHPSAQSCVCILAWPLTRGLSKLKQSSASATKAQGSAETTFTQ